MSNKRTIIYSIYALNPELGSEFAWPWQILTRLSDKYNIIAIYGTTTKKFLEINSFIPEKSVLGQKVSFISAKPSPFTLILFRLNAIRLISPYVFPFALSSWQRDVRAMVKPIIRKNDNTILHSLGPTGFSYPGHFYGLGANSVVGPVGGTQNMKISFFRWLSLEEAIKHTIRNFLILFKLSPLSPLKHYKKYTSVIAATQADKKVLDNQFDLNCSVIRQISAKSVSNTSLPQKNLMITWIGDKTYRKGIKLLAECLNALPAQLLIENNVKITLIGISRSDCPKHTFARELDQLIVYKGYIAGDEVRSTLASSSLMIYTSLLDCNATALLESIEQCVPVIAMSLNGVEDLLTHETGFLVNPSCTNTIAAQYSKYLVYAINHPEVISTKKNNLYQKRDQYMYDQAVSKLDAVYELLA